MTNRITGMYVHQHWSFNHPYAARTWTLEDWCGYLDGLDRLGYDAVLIWPALETMPDPLTASDRQSLKKIARVIDLAHQDFGMKMYIALCPNVAVKSEAARQYTFEQRPFFYCDYRVDPADRRAMDALIQWRARLFAFLSQADGVSIIDSDPGGYPGSTNQEFVDLLVGHRRMFDRLRPGIELIYWIHVGWQAYCDYYRTGEFRWGTDAELEETLSLLATAAPEPWSLANGLEQARRLGLQERVLSFRYGAVEGEPSYPLTNYGAERLLEAAQSAAPRGVMANAQCHCVQLPNTFAFACLARGLAVDDAAHETFGDGLIPGQGVLLLRSWKALAGGVPGEMEQAAVELEAQLEKQLEPGPLRGLLFGDPPRLLRDLAMQLRMRAAFARLDNCLEREGDTVAALRSAVAASETWQECHGYRNAWNRPELEGTLGKLGAGEIDAALDRMGYRGEGETPFARIQSGYYKVETFGPRLLAALRGTLESLSGA